MSMYSFTHLPDHVLASEMDSHLKSSRMDSTVLLAKLAEFDARRMYEPAGYPSMRRYCVDKYGMDEDEAHRWIRVARTAHQFPMIFAALADGRLTQTAVLVLAPHLYADSAIDLLAAAANRSKSQIERMLADRAAGPAALSVFDRVESAELVKPVTKRLTPESPAPCMGLVRALATEPPALRARLTPLSHGYSELLATLDAEGTQALDEVRALLGHSLPSGSIPVVIKRALLCLARELRRRKFAQIDRPRAQKQSAKGRRIPAQVRREVHARDGGGCTFVSDDGHHCASRERLEYDHIVPVARGGDSTTENVRLRCRTHNQYEAKRMFGAGFMAEKREQARQRAPKRVPAPRPTRAPALPEPQAEVIPWLRKLGFNKHEAHRGALLCAAIPTAPLGERVRVALQGLAPSSARRVPFEASGTP